MQSKIVLISKTLGIPGGKLIDESDMHNDVKVFQAFKDEHNGDKPMLEELRLKWLAMIEEDPELNDLVERLPDGISTAKTGLPAGIFVCQRVPVHTRVSEDDESGDWSMEPGRVRWFMGTADGVLEDVGTVDSAIEASRDLAASPFSDKPQVATRLRALERDMTRQLRKELQVPLSAPPPEILCWVEVR